ncbi:MAG: NADH-quinone oxidoreductase subunit J [Deltaproteobacteria bacterium]
MTLFWILASLTIAGALTTVLHRNPVYSALALVFTLFQVAIIFLALDAYLIAFLQVLVYAGAIVVLFLFVIMLLALEPEEPLAGHLPLRATGAVLSIILAAELGALGFASGKADYGPMPEGFGETASVAERLFTAHLLPFELTSVLLLAAVVGAVVMARRKAS